jgi:uncharacterized protein (TIGR03437 family)
LFVRIRLLLLFSLSAVLPAALFGSSAGQDIRRAGVLSDGGGNCSACHSDNGASNSDPRGSIKIEATTYKPGIPQIIRVTVQHPEAKRWGFELTARQVTDETKQAGTFTATQDIRVRCDDTSPVPDVGTAPPCGGTREFATHTEGITRTGANGSKTFEIEWTPPPSEVGAVIIYAAGNAANDNNLPTGDHIYTTTLTVLAGGACSLSKKPILLGVVDAAAGKPGLAMNSLLSIFGRDFQVAGSSRKAGLGDYVNGAFPKQLGCVAVEVEVAGTRQRVPITYVQSDQINAQVPTLTSTGPVRIQVVLNPDQPSEFRSDIGTINIQSYAPALFTFDGTSIAALVAGTATVVANTSLYPAGRPAKPGEYVSLWGNGFGPTDPVFQAGELVGPTTIARLRDPITVTIGGLTVPSSDIQFAGTTPGSISGLYQINVRIPATAPDGDVPVSVTMGGITSPAGSTIPIKR